MVVFTHVSTNYDFLIAEYFVECGHTFGYHQNGVPRMPWESRSGRADNSTEEEKELPSADLKTKLFVGGEFRRYFTCVR